MFANLHVAINESKQNPDSLAKHEVCLTIVRQVFFALALKSSAQRLSGNPI